MQKSEMKHMAYYVVEVAFANNNPIHRATCCHRVDGYIQLFGSYEGVISTHINKLAFFRVVESIDAMNISGYPNHFKLPKDCIEQ